MNAIRYVKDRLCRERPSGITLPRGLGLVMAVLALAVAVDFPLPVQAQACQSQGQSCGALTGDSCCDGLSCGPVGSQFCYDVPRRSGQPCNLENDCGDRGFVCHPLLRLCAPDEMLDPFDDASCAVLHDQSLSDDAVDLGATVAYGMGVVGDPDSGASVEVGVVYGENGEFGCFETRCLGSEPDASGSLFYATGVFNDWLSFPGMSLVTPGADSLPSAGIDFETAQVWTPSLGEQLGSLGWFPASAGFLPVGEASLTCDTTVNEIDCAAGSLVDSDGDGVADCFDGCPTDATKTEEGLCECGVVGADSDGDGTADCADACPDDPSKASPGQCGCGRPDIDADNDGWADCLDDCPDDPAKNAPGLCGCGFVDDATDDDNDGVADCDDACPADMTKSEPGMCGCGIPEPTGSSLTPVLICQNGQAECTGALTPVATQATAVDVCGGVLVSSTTAAGPYPLGSTPVTWSATDEEGRTGTCEATAVVVDTTKPTALCEGDIQECGGPRTGVTLSCTGVDTCDPGLEIMSSAQAGYGFGRHTFTCTATDASGNTDTAECDVSIQDTIRPRATCEGDIQECTGPLTAVTTSCAGSDICDEELDTRSTAAQSYPPGTHGFDCTVTDDAGNADTTSCDIVVLDTTDPTAACRGDLRECTGALTAVTTSCTGNDTCDSQVDTRSTAAAAYPRGTRDFECTATDDAGNTDTVSCDVVVRDTTSPTATCRGDVQECMGALTAVTTSCTGSDTCDSQVDTRSTAAAAYPLGVGRFNCTATDDAGNADTASCSVVIADTIRPEVECAGETVECTGNESAEATVTGSATDICDGDVHVTGTGTARYGLGSHTVTVIGTDDSGNATPCTATVTVEDTIAPRITARPGDDVYECGEAYVEHGATAFDVCYGDLSADIVIDSSTVDTSTPTSSQRDPSVTPYVVHYAVTDGSGHRSTTTRDVTVLRRFDTDGGIVWHQPLPGAANGPVHTDPSGFATSDRSDDYRFPFTRNRTIPVKVSMLDRSGTDITADPSMSASLTVYADANCDRAPDGGAIDIDYNGIGEPGGLMRFDGNHFHYNLATKNWPGRRDGCFVLEVTARVTGTCNDIHTERVWLERVH